ncbi:MAG: ATP-grasp domain-containing protein [Lachnospiraceae bacterium]|nr:ATP-grasp domain-containing protein [Lachnospiraceae bacterium]MBQ4124245.1 ATP-grasp domain-containing protein [bacterium]MBQ6687519.1 ATP-grasp domain-containing protein [Bacilli bacterium]
MRIGIAYDTKDMYNTSKDIYNDFADKQSILSLQKELQKVGYDVTLLGNAQNILELLKKNSLNCDIVYNTVEGISSRNREGIIPALLEAYNVPYIGTDSFGLSLTLNKYLMKVVAQHYGIQTPKSILINYPNVYNDIDEKLEEFDFPIILKPNYEGNSSGISVCDNKKAALEQINNLLISYHTDILCEEFIFGKEITIPYIDTVPNGVWDVTTVDVQKSDDFWLDTNWKLYGDYCNIILNLDTKTKGDFEYAIKTLFRAIGCRDFCRFDFRLTADNCIYFIEANPLPALFKGGSFDVVGNKYGYTYAETVQLIVETACKRLSIPKI